MEEDKMKMWMILAIVNAILGLLLFEWAWYKARRTRTPIHELNSQFPELCRPDALNWQKWKFYPGAVTLLLPRYIFIFGTFFMMSIILNVLMICYDRSRPMGGVRLYFAKNVCQGYIHLMAMVGWFTFFSKDYMTLEQVNYYEEYLGPLD